MVFGELSSLAKSSRVPLGITFPGFRPAPGLLPPLGMTRNLSHV